MSSDLWLIESPVVMVEGESIAYSVDWLGASKVESPDVKVYKDGQEVTSTVIGASPNHTISGNVLTMDAITAGVNDGGASYVVVVQCGVDNNTEIRKLLIRVVKSEAEA